jgi:hypothetical protein
MALYSAEFPFLIPALCTRSSLTKLLPNVGFNGSIRPDIAGSPSSGKLESRPKPTPEEMDDHIV